MAFNLDAAIATWRRSLSHQKTLLAEDLDELELHVREEVAELVDQGHSPEQAFESAMRRMGAGPLTEEAYRKVYWGKLRRKGLLKRSLSSELVMFRNYLMLAVRNLKRRPGYAFINVVGLSVGIGACLLILLFVRDEYSYDRFHEHAERIVRVTLLDAGDGTEMEVTPTAVAPTFKRTFPQVAEVTRVYDLARFHTVTIRRGAEAWQEDGFVYADSTVFDVFTFPFITGTPQEALTRPSTLVLTESAAERYFGDVGSVVGKTLDVGTAGEYEVTGVIEDVPSNSHLQFNMMGSFATTHWSQREIWDSANFYTYVLLTSPQALQPLAEAVDGLVAEARSNGMVSTDWGLGLQRLTDIYLVYMGRQKYVWLFTSLALLILFMACVNYVNLSTARSARRAREVGVRKALGAHRIQIVRQFFSESALMTAVALVGGLALTGLLLPAFNRVTGKGIELDVLGEPTLWVLLAVLLILTTLGAGIYPSLLLSRFRPAVVLKGSKGNRSNDTLRRGLVVFQFAITVFLIVAAGVVYRQLQFIRSVDVGFDREQVVVVQLADANDRRAVPAMRSALASLPSVVESAPMNSIPGNQRGGYSLGTEANLGDQDRPGIGATPVGATVIEALGLRMLSGPGFSEIGDPLVRPDSARYQYVVNEDLVRLAGWTPETAIGKRMSVSGGRRMGDVVGVIENYNFLPLHEQMKPLALFVEPSWHVLLIKLRAGDQAGTLAGIRQIWDDATGGSPFQYSFLDDEYNAFYQSEERLAQVFAGASWLAILIACLGLFGLASYTAEERTREIGIRKTLGATVPGLVRLLNREFAILVAIGFVVAAPAGWWAMQTWLSDYAFRTNVGVGVFAIAGLIAFFVAAGTVSVQSIRAARRNPVVSLRHE